MIPLDVQDMMKPCPKCKGIMRYSFRWIERDGIEYAVPPMGWVCPCGYTEEEDL